MRISSLSASVANIPIAGATKRPTDTTQNPEKLLMAISLGIKGAKVVLGTNGSGGLGQAH